MKKLKLGTVILAVCFILANQTAQADATKNKKNFNDVRNNEYYLEELNALVEKDVISTQNRFFRPNFRINKAEALKILFNLKDIFLEITATNTWEKEYLLLAEKEKVIIPIENYEEASKKFLTRAEACKIILQNFEVDIEGLDKSFSQLHEYQDIAEEMWYSKCIGFAKFYNLINFDSTKFLPNKEISRADFIYFAYRMYVFQNKGNLKNIIPEKNESEEEASTSEESKVSIPEEYLDKLSLLKEGIASYYGKSFEGKSTSSGKIFSNQELIAAHPLLPFGSILKVININNPEKFTEVEVVDCGPFVSSRVIDLSMGAFEQIAPLSAGIAGVRLEITKLGTGKWQDKCYDLYLERTLPKEE